MLSSENHFVSSPFLEGHFQEISRIIPGQKLPHSIPLMEEIMHHQPSVVNMMSESSILLMAEILHHLGCMKPYK